MGAAFGFAQGLINARILGPEAFGVIAIILGINAVVLNFVDIRLTDLAGKLYYQPNIPDDIDRQTYRSSVIQVCLAGNGVIALFFSGLGLVVTFLTINLFTTTPIRWEWIVMHVMATALANWMATFQFLQRFSGRFYLIGTWKIILQLVMMGVFLPILIYFNNLDGYFIGRLIAALVGMIIVIGVSLFIWREHEKFSLMNSRMFVAWFDYWQGRRFLFYGNLLGYAKLLHRAADVLLVGYFSDDRVTGLYKLARTLTDNLYIIFDALNQVYLPRFLELLAQRAFEEFRRLAQRLLIYAGLLTLVILGFEATILPWVIKLALTDRFAGVEGAVVVLTIPVFLVTGIHIWTWPIFIHLGQLKEVTTLNYIACLAQYIITIMFLSLFAATAAGATSGYLAYYLVLIPGTLWLAYRQIPQIIPILRAQSAST